MLRLTTGGVGGGLSVIPVKLSFYTNEGRFHFKFTATTKSTTIVKKQLKFLSEAHSMPSNYSSYRILGFTSV